MNVALDRSDEGVGRPQRTWGEARIGVRYGDGRTRLARLYQEGAAKIRLPSPHDATELQAVMINSGGGLTGGDRMRWDAEAGPDTRLSLTTQACEKVYRAAGGEACVDATLVVGPGARLDWAPQETILFDGAALSRRLDADVADDATLLVLEAVILGRHARGERVRRGLLKDSWRVRRAGKLVFADDVRMAGDVAALSDPSASLAGGGAFASILVVAPGVERWLDPVRRAVEALGYASAFDGKLFCRLVAPDGMSLRAVLVDALSILLDGPALPRVWNA